MGIYDEWSSREEAAMNTRLMHFSTGGYVVLGAIDGKVNAWFNRRGTLTVAQQLDERGKAHDVSASVRTELVKTYSNRQQRSNHGQA